MPLKLLTFTVLAIIGIIWYLFGKLAYTVMVMNKNYLTYRVHVGIKLKIALSSICLFFQIFLHSNITVDKSGFLWNYDKKVPFSVKRVEIHVQKLTLSWFLSWFKFFGGFSTTSHKSKVCTCDQNFGRRVSNML